MKLRAEGAIVHQFEGGERLPQHAGFREGCDAARARENRTRYAPSSGVPELRTAIADKLRTKNNIPAQAGDVIGDERRHAGIIRRLSVSR